MNEKFAMYHDFLQQMVSPQVLEGAFYEGKSMLLIGDAISMADRADFLGELRQAFSGHASRIDVIHLFHPMQMDSQGRLDAADFPAGMQYDFIFVLDGMEKAENPCHAAEKIDAALRLGGVAVVLSRVPGDDPLPDVYLYHDEWRYMAGDLSSLFPGYDVLKEVATNTPFLAASVLRKTGRQSLRAAYEVKGEPELLHKPTGLRVRPSQAASLGYFHAGRELDDMGIRTHTDKCSLGNGYLDKYEMFLRPFREKSFNLLELGVFFGGSTKLWSEYFSQAQIYGVDIMPECRQFEGGNIHVITADLGDEAALRSLRSIQPSIIIDDASHLWSHQIMGICALYDCLPSGGIYIMEDLATSVNPYMFPEYQDYPMDAYTFCERVARVVAGRCPCTPDTSLARKITEIGMATELAVTMMGSCIFIKK